MPTQSNLSLDGLRKRINENQSAGNTEPREAAKQVTVDNSAGIQFGETRGNASGRTELPQDTYSGWFSGATSSPVDDRHTAELRVVRKKLPRNAYAHTTDEGTRGWVYAFNCQFGEQYTMFLYFDGANYQAIVVSPYVEKYWKDPETGHIYADGRICMSKNFGSGQPTLERAYAKSVVWATGFTAARRGNIPFPFNHNQQ